MAYTVIERTELLGGIAFEKREEEYVNYRGETVKYNRYALDGLPDDGIQAMEVLVFLLENYNQISDKVDEDYLREYAAELSEEEEVPFVYIDADTGKSQTYSPAALWEASSGCEWEQSAEMGYDYGWNL